MSARSTRRGFLLQLVGGGAAGLLGAALALPGTPEERAPLCLGELEDLPQGGATELTEHGLIVRRDGDGAYALAARCTHLGCRLRLVGDELVCPCHQGRFDLEGAVIAGPPRRALPRQRLAVAASGKVYYRPERDAEPLAEELRARCCATRRQG